MTRVMIFVLIVVCGFESTWAIRNPFLRPMTKSDKPGTRAPIDSPSASAKTKIQRNSPTLSASHLECPHHWHYRGELDTRNSHYALMQQPNGGYRWVAQGQRLEGTLWRLFSIQHNSIQLIAHVTPQQCHMARDYH
ncbi:hypothetical protein [Celerinatantimonas yamalensis]|uniref:MSHA biogenesis protein MshK n=1 Tax=Celerinatantimonas yamalensis TaxID=559956 RepID=A0ABW9G833_9GAMM